jgi:hypothetical protein
MTGLYDKQGQRQRHNQVMEFQGNFSGKVQRPMTIPNPTFGSNYPVLFLTIPASP